MAGRDLLREFMVLAMGCIREEDGAGLAQLLAVGAPGHWGGATAAARLSGMDVASECSTLASGEWSDVVGAHLEAWLAWERRDWAGAARAQREALAAVQAVWKENPWCLPVVFRAVLDYRLLASRADDEAARAGVTSAEKHLTECENSIKSVFRDAVTDRSQGPASRKRACLYLVVNMFKIHFKLGTIRLCKNLVHSIESGVTPSLEELPRSHGVPYLYYKGRLLLLEEKFGDAAACLSAALRQCHRAALRNRRLILEYLIPARLLTGVLPSLALLERHGLAHYVQLVTAVRHGNLRLFNEVLAAHQTHFIRRGVLLVLEKLFVVVLRNLVKRIYLVKRTPKFNLRWLEAALEWLGESMDADEVECVVANLVYKRYVRGYISHKHHYLVLSKENAFPPVSSVVSS